MIDSKTLDEDADIVISDHGQLLDALAGTHVLITGAAGFLCAYFLEIIARYNQRHEAKQIKVLATDNFLSGLPARLAEFTGNASIAIEEHDVLQPLESALEFQYIIHGASIASPVFYRRYPIETMEVNVNGTWNLLRRAVSDSSDGVLYFSSSEIYGDPSPDNIPTKESYLGNVSCIGPRACYDESKRMGETLAYNYFRQKGVPVKIVRPFNVYGPGQNLQDQRIVPDIMSAAVHGHDIRLFSDGAPTRSFCYARDFFVGAMYALVMGKPAEAYNIGNDEEISIRGVAELMAEIAGDYGRQIRVEFATSDDSDYLVHNPNRRCPDLTKAKTEFGWVPVVKVREGLRRTLASYIEAGMPEMQVQ